MEVVTHADEVCCFPSSYNYRQLRRYYISVASLMIKHGVMFIEKL